jgi:NodT family efflux transporter outer membrane factor (OMF) lipoprotein
VLSALLAGCTARPLPKLDNTLPAAWRHELSPALAAPDLRGWWADFDDAALTALVDRALAQNLALQAARERLLAARVLRAHSRAAYLPSLRVRTEDAIDPSATASYLVTSLDAIWELGLFGRREGTQRLLQAQADNADAEIAGVQVSLIGEVVADYLQLGAAHEREAVLSQMSTLQEARVSLLRVRESLGLASPQDIAIAESNLARAQAAESAGGQQIDATSAQLAVLLGRSSPESAWLDGGRLARLRVAAVVDAPAELLRTRPEIRRAEAAVLSAAGAADIASADRLPNVGIGGSIHWSANLFRNRNRASTFNIASIGPIVDMPLFDWGLRRAHAQSKSHLLNAAAMDYRDAVLRGVAEVETALGRLQRDALQEADAEIAAAALRRAAAMQTRRVNLQLASPLDADLASMAAAEADLAVIDARAEHGMAYVALYKALGGAPRPQLPTPTGSP